MISEDIDAPVLLFLGSEKKNPPRRAIINDVYAGIDSIARNICRGKLKTLFSLVSCLFLLL